jgi:hypothetical protein
MGVAIGIVVLAVNLWRSVGPLRRVTSLAAPRAGAVM